MAQAQGSKDDAIRRLQLKVNSVADFRQKVNDIRNEKIDWEQYQDTTKEKDCNEQAD